MPDLMRLISGLMSLGNVLLAISDRCWIDHFVIDGLTQFNRSEKASCPKRYFVLRPTELKFILAQTAVLR
jgi:hypothetical protein